MNECSRQAMPTIDGIIDDFALPNGRNDQRRYVIELVETCPR